VPYASASNDLAIAEVLSLERPWLHSPVQVVRTLENALEQFSWIRSERGLTSAISRLQRKSKNARWGAGERLTSASNS
jgi:hypothetical protein